jgi:hypothetical protein
MAPSERPRLRRTAAACCGIALGLVFSAWLFARFAIDPGAAQYLRERLLDDLSHAVRR